MAGNAQEKIDRYTEVLRSWSLDSLLTEYYRSRVRWSEIYEDTYQIQMDIVQAEIERRIAE